MTKRGQQKEQTKAKISEAAQAVFAEKGFLRTSVDDLTRAAGVSHGSFFVHYARREDLIVQVIEELGAALYARFLALASERTSLEAVLGAHLDAVAEFEPVYRHLAAEGPFLPEAARTALFVLQNGIGHWIGQALEPADPARPPGAVFNLWMGNLHYHFQNRDLFAPEGSLVARYRDHFIQLFLVFERRNNHG